MNIGIGTIITRNGTPTKVVNIVHDSTGGTFVLFQNREWIDAKRLEYFILNGSYKIQSDLST